MVTNGNISFEEMKDKIFCEDCLIGMQRIPDGTIDAVICDLPYGTTAIACIKERRHFIGFELNKEYYDKACKRIKEEQQQLTLF